MIYCPKCKESLGDNITTCPFCFHEITDYERVLIAKEQRKEEDDAHYEEIIKAEAYARIRLVCMLGAAVYLVVLFLIFSILMYAGLLMPAFTMFSVGMIFYLLMSAYLILIKRINNCPHCGKYLFRNWGTNCQWCGGIIR